MRVPAVVSTGCPVVKKLRFRHSVRGIEPRRPNASTSQLPPADNFRSSGAGVSDTPSTALGCTKTGTGEPTPAPTPDRIEIVCRLDLLSCTSDAKSRRLDLLTQITYVYPC